MNPQEFLPYIGMALQWARARQKFAEWWYLAIVGLTSVGFYALGHPVDAFAQRWDIVVAGIWPEAKTILALTQLTSSGAKVINSMNGESTTPHPLLPITDSQK